MSSIIRAFNFALAGNTDELGAMLTMGAVKADATRADSSMYTGWSLLHAGVAKNHYSVVKLLLEPIQKSTKP